MMKKFLIKSLIVGIPFFVLLVFPNVYNFKTSGDLGDLSLIYFDDSYRKSIETQKPQCQTFYCKSVYELMENRADILVIGDSFAHKGFQDYLSVNINKSVTTLWHNLDIEANAIFTTLMLEKRDLIPDVVIIESVERVFVKRLMNMKLDTVLDVDSIYYRPKAVQINYIDKAQDFYKKKLGMSNPVKMAKLSKSLYTCKDKERDLYFYQDDLYTYSESDVNTAFENLKLLHNYAKSKGVFLIYVVAADKYDVYQDYIVNNPYKPNKLLSEGNRFDSLPYFINTKYILTETSEMGVKDIYWADDTHWSPVGAKIVAEEIARKIDSFRIFKDKGCVVK